MLWVEEPDGRHVRAISVQIGLTDGLLTEVRGPDVKEGMEVVIGEGPENGSPEDANPFIPQIRRPTK